MLTYRRIEAGSIITESNYAYDALGRRLEKRVVYPSDSSKDFTRRYMYDGGEIVTEVDEKTQVLANYTHSNLRTDDVLSVQVTTEGKTQGLAKAEGNYFYLKDSLGTITDITDGSGNLIQHFVYSPFGEIIRVTNKLNEDISSDWMIRTSYAFTNREYDEESGLYYYRARYYDASTGRFLQVDPDPGKLANPITHINKYIYAGNNPIMFTDPMGMSFLGSVGKFFGGRGGWGTDLITAAAVVGIIVASGGTAAGALIAVGATAAGSALAAGGMAAFQGGNFFDNFSNNFHTIFRVSATFLAGSAVYAGTAGGGISSAGANGWFQGSIASKNGIGGLTIGSSSTYVGGSSWLASHEAMHTIQFALMATTVSAVNKYGNLGMSNQDQMRYTWYLYLATGAVTSPGLGNDGAIFPL